MPDRQSRQTLRLDDLPDHPHAHPGDPGRDWHPRADKTGARSDDGNLRDLTDAEVAEHVQKPEAEDHIDSVLRRRRRGDKPLAAEDSAETDDGEV